MRRKQSFTKRHASLGELPPESAGCRDSGDQREDGLEDQARVDRTIKASSSGRVEFCDQDSADSERGNAIEVSGLAPYTFRIQAQLPVRQRIPSASAKENS